MPIFKPRQALAAMLPGRLKSYYSRRPARFFAYYVAPPALFCTAYIIYNRLNLVTTGNYTNQIALVAVFTSVLLLFQLVKTERQKKAVEKKLANARLRFEKIYNAGIVGLLYTRLDGVITHANDYFLEMIGYSREELRDGLVSWKTLTPPTFQAASALAVEQLKTTGSCEPFEKEYTRKDGSAITVLLASALLTDDDEAEAVTYIIDITHKKQARLREDELHQYILRQKEELHRLLMNAPTMISVRRGPELRLEFSNQATINYTGSNNHVGLTLKEITDRFSVDKATAIIEKVYQTGERFTAKAFHLKMDRNGDGKPEDAWFDYVVEPLLNEKGETDGVVSFGFDVTDMVKANAELKDSERRFRFLADSLPHKIWTCGPNGQPNYYNKGWYDYLDVQTFDELHVAIWEAIHPDDLANAQSLWENALLNGEDLELEQRFKNARGVYQWHLTRCCAHKNQDGEIVMWVGSSTNIQEQKAVQETADLLSRKKDEFLGIASHELKTPITTIKASLEILDNLAEQGFDAQKVKSFVGMANKQVRKLNSIVDELLDVTRIQAGRMSLNNSSYSFLNSVENCLEEVKPYLKHHQLTLEPGPDVIIFADRIRVEQVIVNLLVNAIKYSPNGGDINVKIAVHEDRIRLSVADNGIGIALSRQALIFEKFSRAHDASEKFAGLGLGLYISLQIIRQHGGEIGVNSLEGKGSTFWFDLPLNITPATA